MQPSALTDIDIQNLIACKKVFRARPHAEVIENRNVTQKFSVYSEDGADEFRVFTAYSQRMPSDFSIGLMYNDYQLIRFNGFHGTTAKGFFSAAHHAVPHSHTLTENDIKSGRGKKPSLITELAGEYVDLASARVYFFRHCGIIGYEQYFETHKQLSLFDTPEE